MIKQFLVGLGFSVDDSSFKAFTKGIASATLRVTALVASIKIASAAIFYSISKISQSFEQFGYEARIIAPAINRAILLRQEMTRAYKAAGIDVKKAVMESVRFNLSLDKTKIALDAIYKSVGLKFLPMLTKQMDAFRAKIYANMPRIQAILERFVKFVFKGFEAVVILGQRLWSIFGRVYDALVKLDEATNGWSTKILILIGLWRLLNLAFLATPLGMILTGLLAILALYDDFMTWQEGGESLFDWGKFLPILDDVKSTVMSIIDAFKSWFSVIGNIYSAFQQLFTGGGFTAFIDRMKAAIDGLVGTFKGLWGVVSGVGSTLGSIAGLIGSGQNVLSGSGRSATGSMNAALTPPPLMGSGSTTNQRVQQQTSITVQGSADPQATGRAVASEQNRVNFDLTRNLRGAAQ